LNGIVVVDKPEGMSSAQVVSRVKHLYGAHKVGHAGTLDPSATGVLICCLNRATRLSRFLLAGDKTYEAVMRLGADTDTQDASGTVTGRYSLDGVDGQRIRQAAARFVGSILQVPPVYSALKHRGVPLYKLARRGQAVEKPARQVAIHRLDILDVQLPMVRFAVTCSAGTYVRTLCADMGRDLECGGHLWQLRRTASCGFGIDNAFDLETLAAYRDQGRLDETVIGMNAALPRMPMVVADDTVVKKIRNGGQLVASDLPAPAAAADSAAIKVVDAKDRLVAVLARDDAGSVYNYCCVFPT
jgi:tRNA pseudouridine55 synthase